MCPIGPTQEDADDMINWKDDQIDFSQLSMEKLQKIIDKDGPYYPKVEGCDNAYRDGYITEPPKKPRASYIFFQCTMRPYFANRNPKATQGELMSLVGEQWNSMSDEEQQPFFELAKEEAKEYEKERFLMVKAQKPNEMWQPIRRCLMVLDRISKDSFASIFLEPVDLEEFNDYEELIDQPMDLGTVRTKLMNKKYQAPEQFARDVRKVNDYIRVVYYTISFLDLLLAHISILPVSSLRFGITAKSTIVMAQLSGKWPTTWQSNLKGYTMLGF
jgi:hypothetical protein